MGAENPDEWRRTPLGHQYGRYRIVIMPDAPTYRWRLDVCDDVSNDSPSWATVSYHRRLRTAKAHAAGLARERLRTRRIAWRIVAGSIAMLLATGAATLPPNIGVVAIGVTGFAFALRFWLEAAVLIVAPGDHALGDSWPRLENLALHVADRARRRAERREPAGSRGSQIQILPPEPESVPDEENGPGHVPASPMHIC